VFVIRGKQELFGSVTIGGSKNAALPLLAACMLIHGKVELSNVPDISDIHDFLHFYESLGAYVHFKNNTLEIDSSSLSLARIDTSKIARTRAGIYFIAGLLARFRKAEIPFPAGDKIGKRPIDEHINGYTDMGYIFEEKDGMLLFSGAGSQENVKTTAYFAVTATANLIMGAATRTGTTNIELAAFEPHIFNLIDFLRRAGVRIDIRYDHTIIVHGV